MTSYRSGAQAFELPNGVSVHTGDLVYTRWDRQTYDWPGSSWAGWTPGDAMSTGELAELRAALVRALAAVEDECDKRGVFTRLTTPAA